MLYCIVYQSIAVKIIMNATSEKEPQGMKIVTFSRGMVIVTFSGLFLKLLPWQGLVHYYVLNQLDMYLDQWGLLYLDTLGS